ncbi:MAG TPA: phosphatidate cytidylyltransferase, partial [Desulfuromonadales bacterium]|nr:phosphatidate cytidylyltransferase [Desulfuromonadales bacterium]
MVLPLLVLFIAYAGIPLFVGLIMMAAFLGLLELYGMALPNERRPEMLAAALAGTLLVPVLVRSASWGVVCALALSVVFFASLFLFR